MSDVFPIYARFSYPENGCKGDQQMAAEYLTVGQDYLIRSMEVGQSHTAIRLHDFPDLEFNQVLFSASPPRNGR